MIKLLAKLLGRKKIRAGKTHFKEWKTLTDLSNQNKIKIAPFEVLENII